MHADSHRRNKILNLQKRSATDFKFLYFSLRKKLQTIYELLENYINFKRGPRELIKDEMKCFYLKSSTFYTKSVREFIDRPTYLVFTSKLTYHCN